MGRPQSCARPYIGLFAEFLNIIRTKIKLPNAILVLLLSHEFVYNVKE
jgi:hypothetical protein